MPFAVRATLVKRFTPWLMLLPWVIDPHLIRIAPVIAAGADVPTDSVAPYPTEAGAELMVGRVPAKR